jgi:LAO/AO transport system kinase
LKSRLTVDEYASGILAGDRVVLGKAITLVESRLPEDQQQVSILLEKIIQYTGSSIRIGITGVPGVGKSTFIETFGKLITSRGKKIAVLTVDPEQSIDEGKYSGR